MERHTTQRQIILRALKLTAEPISAARLATQVKKKGISRATLFRALKTYVAGGQIALVEGRDGKPEYIGHVYHQAIFRCQRCGKERRLKSQTLPAYVDRKMFGHQSIVTSQLIAQGLCASCTKKVRA